MLYLTYECSNGDYGCIAILLQGHSAYRKTQPLSVETFLPKRIGDGAASQSHFSEGIRSSRRECLAKHISVPVPLRSKRELHLCLST